MLLGAEVMGPHPRTQTLPLRGETQNEDALWPLGRRQLGISQALCHLSLCHARVLLLLKLEPTPPFGNKAFAGAEC